MTPGNRAGPARFVGVPPTMALLQSLLYLKGLPLDEVADQLQSNALIVEFPPGEDLARQDDVAECLFFILSGNVRVTRRDKNAAGLDDTLERVAIAGDVIGRYELTFSLNYTSTATAQNAVSALCVERATLERILYRFPAANQQAAYQATVNRLRTMPLLADVDMVILGFLADEIRTQTVEAGAVLYTQNQAPDTFFLIAQGQIELYHPRTTDNRLLLGNGGAFGFPGSVGVTNHRPPDKYGHWAEAKTKTTVFELPWKTVRQIGRRFPQAIDPEIQTLPAKTISAISIFAGLTPQEQIQLAGFCSFHRIPQYHPIMQQGDSADSMWILLENHRAVLSALDEDNRALPRAPVRGAVTFNDAALLAPTPVELTVESEPGSLWLRLHRKDFQRFGQICGPEIVDKVAVRLPSQADDANHEQRQNYPWLRKDELLVKLQLRHWLAMLSQTKATIVVLLASAGFVWLLAALGLSIWVGLGFSALLLLLTLIWGVLNYLNDYFVVTNRRVIQQEKIIFFSEQRQEALLEQIQRVDVATTFWGNLFNYGTLSVYTAGTTGSIDFDFVSHPDSLRTAIFHHRSLCQQRSSAENKLDIQNALENRLGLSVDLPDRVQTDAAPLVPDEKASRFPFWHQLRRNTTVNRSLERESTDRIVWHKHWWILFAHVALPSLLFLLEILFLAGGFSSVPFLQGIQASLDAQTLLISGGLVTLATLGWILWAVSDWWNDTYTVTEDRIIDIEKLPLFLSEQRREAQLSDIQDIRLEMNSPLKVMLNFGNITVQTAAGEGAFTFDHVPNPRHVKEEITRRMIAWRRADERRKAQDRSKDLPDWFEMYNRLETGKARNQDLNPESNL